MDRPILAVLWRAGQTARRDRASHCVLSPFSRAWPDYMVKTNYLGALAATAGVLVVGGGVFLKIMGVWGGGAGGGAGGGGSTSPTKNTNHTSRLSISPAR